MTRFVLVHGAFMGAWCWEPVAEALRGAGHEVEAPDLPGSGADRAHIADAHLDAYVARVAELLDRRKPAVLVGHSLGGITITAVASRYPAGIAQLIYLAAFLPGDGQSAMDLTRLPEGRYEGLRRRMLVSGDPPVATLSRADARAVLFNSCPPQVAEPAIARLGPSATWISKARVPAGDNSSVPSSYVVCTKDLAIPPQLQRRMARESSCFPIVEIETDHSPFLSDPSVLVDALVSLTNTALVTSC